MRTVDRVEPIQFLANDGMVKASDRKFGAGGSQSRIAVQHNIQDGFCLFSNKSVKASTMDALYEVAVAASQQMNPLSGTNRAVANDIL